MYNSRKRSGPQPVFDYNDIVNAQYAKLCAEVSHHYDVIDDANQQIYTQNRAIINRMMDIRREARHRTAQLKQNAARTEWLGLIYMRALQRLLEDGQLNERLPVLEVGIAQLFMNQYQRVTLKSIAAGQNPPIYFAKHCVEQEGESRLIDKHPRRDTQANHLGLDLLAYSERLLKHEQADASFDRFLSQNATGAYDWSQLPIAYDEPLVSDWQSIWEMRQETNRRRNDCTFLESVYDMFFEPGFVNDREVGFGIECATRNYLIEETFTQHRLHSAALWLEIIASVFERLMCWGEAQWRLSDDPAYDGMLLADASVIKERISYYFAFEWGAAGCIMHGQGLSGGTFKTKDEIASNTMEMLLKGEHTQAHVGFFREWMRWFNKNVAEQFMSSGENVKFVDKFEYKVPLLAPRHTATGRLKRQKDQQTFVWVRQTAVAA